MKKFFGVFLSMLIALVFFSNVSVDLNLVSSAQAQNIAISGLQGDGGGAGDLPCWSGSMEVSANEVVIKNLCVTSRDGDILSDTLKAGDVLYIQGVGDQFPSPNDLTDDSNKSAAIGQGVIQGNGANASVRIPIQPRSGGTIAQVMITWVEQGGDRLWGAPAKVVNGVTDGATVLQSHGGHQINAIVFENGRVRLPTYQEKVAICLATPAVDDAPATHDCSVQKGGSAQAVVTQRPPRPAHPPRPTHPSHNPPPPAR